jgi:chloramphenicol-sensitive protein RarD
VSENQNENATAATPRKPRGGLLSGFSAYVLWGVFPIYFHALSHVPPLLIVCHRVVWSVLLLVGIVVSRREWQAVFQALTSARIAVTLAISGVLIASNWLIFIYAVSTDRILEASLGYFINPLCSIALGMIFLGERLRRWQWVAVIIALVAVLNLAFRGGHFPWIALTLAATFGLYGLLRKRVDVHPLHGLLVETVLLLPFAITGLIWLPSAPLPANTLMLLSLTGIITAAPLLLFGIAVRQLKLSTLGFLQYVGPTLQFIVAIVVFREPMPAAKFASFALCWAGIAVYVADSVWTHTAQPVADRPE